MTEDEAPDGFDEQAKQQILSAYGYASEAELNARIEEAFPGYLAAHAEWEAEKAAFTAELQERMEEATAAVSAWGQAHGMLPDGVELVPIDLQADAQRMASEPPQFVGMLEALDGEYVPPPRCRPTFTYASEPQNVLDRIDSAIEDWELGPDAMRWGSADAGMPETFTEITFDTRPARPAPFVGAEVVRAASDFQQQTQALVQAAGRTLVEISTSAEVFTAAFYSAHESALKLARGLRLGPWPHGWNEPCFCHPEPFPAARDYRRRTKHRNRRRKS